LTKPERNWTRDNDDVDDVGKEESPIRERAREANQVHILLTTTIGCFVLFVNYQAALQSEPGSMKLAAALPEPL